MPREQEIAKGVFMTKRKKKEKDKLLTLFKNLNFNVNLNGSTNVEIEGCDSLEKQIIVPFQTTTEVAKILLKKGWTLKTKFKFTYTFPTFEEQQQHLRKHEYQKDSQIQQSYYLENLELDNLQEEKISQILIQKNQKFIDHEFLPNSESLGFGDSRQQFERFECIVHWRRIQELQKQIEDENQKFQILDHIYSHNVIQGLLNNHWFLSALMCIAENQKLVKRLFKTKKFNENNFYRLKIGQMGCWKETILDDYVPCYPLEEPIFGTTEDNELWVLLIEKCYAKMFYNYSYIEQGEFKDALLDLTCVPLFSYEIQLQNQENLNQIHKNIKEALKNYWIACVQFRKVQGMEQATEQQLFQYGFYISRLEHYQDETLVEIKNNWNLFEWNGSWSEEDEEKWTPESIEKLQPDFENQNVFWMNINDLQQNFQFLHISKTQVWNELRQKGKFIQAIEVDNEFNQHFCSRWVYVVKVQKLSNVIIGLHQEDEKRAGAKQNRPYLDIGLAILSFQQGVYRLLEHKKSNVERQIFLEVNLLPGNYIIVPYSTGINLKFASKEPKQINLQEKQFLSIVEDTFQKIDLKSKGHLDQEQIKNFCNKTDLEYDKDEIEELFENSTIQNQNNLKGISFKKFKDFMFQKFHRLSDDEQYQLLEKMGYEKSFFSKKSRLFVLSIHSNFQVLLNVQDALKDKFDYLINNLICKKNGEQVFEKDEIILYRNFNNYALVNRSDKKKSVKINLSSNSNLILSNDQKIITKNISPQNSIFVTHCKFENQGIEKAPEVNIDIN